jgi:L-threonylcarbamoyladenylate synthase
VNAWHLRLARRALMRGALVLHATEGVWGLACDPEDRAAVAALLAAKGRSAGKGLIVIGDRSECFAPELAAIGVDLARQVHETWPGPVTWILPSRRFASWVTGGRDTIAARVPGHPQARALARAFGGPLISTSANRSGRPPARTRLQARRWLRNLERRECAVPIYLLPGETLGRREPSEIRTLGGRLLRGQR